MVRSNIPSLLAYREHSIARKIPLYWRGILKAENSAVKMAYREIEGCPISGHPFSVGHSGHQEHNAKTLYQGKGATFTLKQGATTGSLRIGSRDGKGCKQY